MDQVDSVPDKWAVLIGVEYYEHPEQPTATPRHDGRGNKIEYETLAVSTTSLQWSSTLSTQLRPSRST